MTKQLKLLDKLPKDQKNNSAELKFAGQKNENQFG